MNSKHDRASGCLIGLAVGDALGATLEFTRPGCYHPAGGNWFDLHPSILEISEGSFKQRNPPEICGS